MTLLRRADPWIVAILALALGVRVLLVLLTRDALPQLDAADYDAIARSLAAGDGFPGTVLAAGGGPAALRPPAYPLMLAAVYLVADEPLAGRLAQAVLGTVSVGLVGVLAHQTAGRASARVAMAIAAVYPSMVLTDAALLSEALFVPLMLGALAAGLAARGAPRPLRWAAVAGILIGASVLTRPLGAVLLVPVVAAVMGASAVPRGERARAAAAVAVCAILVVLPWTARNTVEFGRFVPVSTQAGLLAGTYNDQSRTDPRDPGAWRPPTIVPEHAPLFEDRRLDEAELDAELRRRTLQYARAHPGYVVSSTLRNAQRMLHFGTPEFEVLAGRDRNIHPRLVGVSRWAFWLLALLAAAGALTRGGRAIPWHVWAAAAFLFASGAALAGLIRYRTVVDPLLILPAAQAVIVLSARLASNRRWTGTGLAR